MLDNVEDTLEKIKPEKKSKKDFTGQAIHKVSVSGVRHVHIVQLERILHINIEGP